MVHLRFMSKKCITIQLWFLTVKLKYGRDSFVEENPMHNDRNIALTGNCLSG